VAETKLAIVADLGTLQRLARVVGPGHAREMAFTSDALDAQRAARINLVNSVFPDQEQMLTAARAMAAKIAALSPLAVQGTKVTLNYADDHSLRDGLKQVALFNSAFLLSSDTQEAMTAFMTKRTPTFKSRL